MVVMTMTTKILNFEFFLESKKKISKITKINWIDCPLISVEFDGKENRVIDFKKIVNKLLYADPGEPEYKLLNETEFKKVSLKSGTLVWSNIKINVLGYKISFELDSDTLKKWSKHEK